MSPLTHMDQNRVETHLLFAGNLTRQPYMLKTKYRVHGELTTTDNVMNDASHLGVQPFLTRGLLVFTPAVSRSNRE